MKKTIFASIILAGSLLTGFLTFNLSNGKETQKVEAATYTQTAEQYYSGFDNQKTFII